MTWNWLRHAFAIDPPGPAIPTETQFTVVDRVCREIVRRRLTTPAILLLEFSRPLNYLGAQMLHFFLPLVSTLTNSDGYREFSAYLEQRGSIDYICRHLEACASAPSESSQPLANEMNRPAEADPPAGVP